MILLHPNQILKLWNCLIFQFLLFLLIIHLILYHIQELVNHYNINEIFTEKANFTRISESNLSINKMIQKNNLTIAEKGTLKSNLKQQTLYNLDDDYKEQIILNRPYAYLIINNETSCSLEAARTSSESNLGSK